MMTTNNAPHANTDPIRLSLAFWSLQTSMDKKTFTDEKAVQILSAWYPDCAPDPSKGWTAAEVDNLYFHAYYIIIGMQESYGCSIPECRPLDTDGHAAFGAQVILGWTRDWAKQLEARPHTA